MDNIRKPKYDNKGNLVDIKVLGKLDIVGHCTTSYLIQLRQSAVRLNNDDPSHIYTVIQNPRGQKFGYYLVREVT